MALECESCMENMHMQSALLMKERVGNSMFKAMMKEDRGHVLMLQAALDEVQKKSGDEETLDIEELNLLDMMEFQQAEGK